MTAKPSRFIWYELLTSDAREAADFYGAVMGWTVQDSGQAGMDYKMWLIGGEGVGGLLKITPDMASSGMDDGWLGYVDVADVDAAVADIVAAGGHAHMDQTVPGVGRMAMVSDPQGALFYVMKPEGTGVSTVFAPGQPGHGGWNELHTKDAEAAAGFYRNLLGWHPDAAYPMGEMGNYLTFNGGAEPIAGVFNSPGFPKPKWLFYFNVDDIDAAKARVGAAGGKVHAGPMPVPTGEWMINASDPKGAMFGLLGSKSAAAEA
jgi:predicted enzyme related to lactoylglutathione lyase